MDARADRAIEFQNQLAWLAWHIAVLGRAKRMPRLDALKVKKKRAGQPAARTWQQQMAVMDAWVARTKKG